MIARTALVFAVTVAMLGGCGAAKAGPMAAQKPAAKPTATRALPVKAPIARVSVNEAAVIAAEPQTVFIDVREPGEYATGHARGAELRPLGELATWAKTLDKSAPTLLICQSGRRSMVAAQGLIDRGFTHVINVDGGTSAWIGAGLPTDK